jgi:hypothetical protein
MATDNDLSGLLGELRAGGQHDSHGQFTLDRAQARAKMQKFQLVDARRYVLELVQAALLRGAIDLRFDIDADDLRMRFDGESFRAEELGELWASIFTDGDEPLLRGLRQLALGLNAALGLNPRRITVRSGGHQLVLRPDADELLTALEPGAQVAGTTIHVEQRLRLGIIVDFLRNITGRLAEEQYLREGCLHCQMPVLLDGVGLPGGLTVAGAIAEHEFVTIEMSGVIALVPGEAPATLRLIKDGVWIDTLPLEGCGPGIVAVLEGERLRKDVSLAKIVADEALAQAIARVRGERWGLMARLVEAARRGGPKAEPTLARVRAEVLQFLRPRDLRKRPDVALVLETLRWPDARTGGRELRSVSLAELAAQAGDGEVPGMLAYARQEYPELVSEGPPILRIDAEIAVQLGRILACAPVVCDVELAQRSARVVARKAWLRRPMPARLPDDRRYLVRAPIAAAGLRGELGVGVQAGDEAPQAEGTLWLLREGCLLLRVELAWGVPALDVVLEGSFEPGELYDDVLRDQALVAAALQVIAGLQVPLAALVEGSRDGALAPAIRGLVKAWLLLVLDAQARDQLWEALKVPGALRPELAAVQAVLPSPALLRAGGGALDVLLQMPLFEDLDGAPRSLDELARRQAQVGRLDEVDRAVAPEPSLGRDVAWLGRGDRKILAGLLGGEQALRSWVPSLAVRRRERKFWSAPPQTIAELAAKMHAELQAAGLDPALWSRTLRVGPVEAVIMLAHGSVPPGVEPRLAQIELRFQGRPLETRSLDLGLWPLVGAATSTALQPTPEWDEAGDEAAVEAIVVALREAAWALMAGLLAHHGEALARWRWVAVPLLQRLAAPDGELFAARWPGLTALPLLHTLDGGAMSIDAVDAVLRAHRHIEWVPPTTPTIDLGAPPVLRETAQVMTAMRLRFGAKSVVDGEERLRRRGRDEQLAGLPAAARAELDASLVWARVSLASGQPGITGEIGLARERGAGGLALVLCTRGRQVGVFTESDVPAPTVAILADEALPIDAQGKVDQRSKRYGQHLRRCRKAVPGLIVGLCARFGSLDAEARASARALLLGYATAMLRRVAAGGVTTDRGLDAVRGLPLFVDVQGRAHALTELEPGGSVDAVGPEAAAPEPGLELEQTVLRVDAAAAACLAAVIRVRRLDDRWDDEMAALRELARAPRFELPDLRRVAWVEREATIAGGLQAQLWIARAPAEAEALVFTRTGREVGRLAVLAALPCSGVVSGKGLTIGGEGVELDRRQRGSLAKQICALYETLAKTLRAGRLPLDQRERALARLVEVDAALATAGDPLLAELGKPLEQLRAALAGLISPAMRRERAPMRAAEPTARAGLGASPGAAAGISPSAASGAEISTSGAEISAESAEISAEGAEISAEGAKISPSAAAGAEISPSAAPPRSAASRAAPSVSGGSAAVSRPARAAGAPMPAAAALTPEQGLLAALRAELAWARERHGTLLDALGLDRLTVGDTRVGGLVAFERGIVVQRWHPLVVRMLERLAAGGAVDPIELSFVVSSAYTLMNEIAEEIDAEDERAFVARLAESLAHGLGVRM